MCKGMFIHIVRLYLPIAGAFFKLLYYLYRPCEWPPASNNSAAMAELDYTKLLRPLAFPLPAQFVKTPEEMREFLEAGLATAEYRKRRHTRPVGSQTHLVWSELKVMDSGWARASGGERQTLAASSCSSGSEGNRCGSGFRSDGPLR